MAETFHGYIETTQDVLLIFEGCRRGLIPRVCRRLQEKERRMIRSGSVFVFDERESGIKRWTDGLVWSPSRILGNFLIYRELDKRAPGDKKLSISSSSSNDARQRSYSADQSVLTSGMSNDRNRERRLVGSLSDSYRFRKDGLIKKTMSIIVNGVAQHLISYYLPNDIISNKLRTPSSVPDLASLEISPDLLVKQNFRIPPMVEPSFDQTEAALTGGSSMNTYSDDRRMHPFRSMSLGSVRSSNNYGPNPAQQQQLLYTTSSSLGRMDMEDTKVPNNNPMATYYANQPMYNTNNSNNGFPPLPSPSSMTSSPNTPMLSPVRQSFSQQPTNRHYSMSSTSSGSMNRYNNRNSFEMMPPTGPPHHSVHPHNISESSIYDQQQQQQQQQQRRSSLKQDNDPTSSSPNIGQLLNPVHPLHNGAETNNGTAQLFQPMGMNDTTTATTNTTYPDYKLPSIPNNDMMQQQQRQTNSYGGSYYRQPQQTQPLANTHHASTVTNVPMFQNGMVHPSMYDETRPELGMETFMLK